MFNLVVLTGRLCNDAELKYTQSNIPVCSFTLAVDRRGKGEDKQTDFINIVAWRQTAEFISKYFRKGSAICVTGSIRTGSSQDQQGQKRYFTDVVVDEAMFVDSRSEGGNAQGGSYVPDAYNSAPSYSSNVGSTPNFEELTTDDDLPF